MYLIFKPQKVAFFIAWTLQTVQLSTFLKNCPPSKAFIFNTFGHFGHFGQYFCKIIKKIDSSNGYECINIFLKSCPTKLSNCPICPKRDNTNGFSDWTTVHKLYRWTLYCPKRYFFLKEKVCPQRM